MLRAEIAHRKVSICKRGDCYDLGEDEPLFRGLEGFHETVLAIAAAAVYRATGSLNKAASLLRWAGFWDNEEDLRRWVEENREHILARAEGETAKAIASD